MKLRLARTLRTAFGHQPDEPVDLQQTTHDRSTNPGHLSVDLCVFMLMKKELFDFFSDYMRDHIVVEAGAGPGYFSMAASILGGEMSQVLAIERDRRRACRLASWKDELMRGDHVDELLLPVVIHGDFTKEINELENAISTNRLAVFINNFRDSLGPSQVVLENKLSTCIPGTVVISLHPMFTRDLSWGEKKIRTIVPRKHVSWSTNDSDGRVPIMFYRYTKLENGERNRRVRDASDAVEIPYCFLRTNYF